MEVKRISSVLRQGGAVAQWPPGGHPLPPSYIVVRGRLTSRLDAQVIHWLNAVSSVSAHGSLLVIARGSGRDLGS